MNGLFNSSRPSKEEISTIITELSSLTRPKKYDAVMAGNIKVTTEILQVVVNFNKKFSSSREVVSSNVEASIWNKLGWYRKFKFGRQDSSLEIISSELDELKPALRLPIRWGKMGLSCPLEIARLILGEN